ncbi:MAG TPA: cation:proton antiporter [Candidatus Thermoplasmatota archaeon]|nr:cation:proton antiporter [Candidatus Thermoplasmatota archaeon]
MADEFVLIRDLALVLVTAAVTAMVFHRLRMPLVLGYLAAGALVGPHVAGLITRSDGSAIISIGDPANIRLLAQIGVLFVLFSLGLDFHLGKLRRVGGLALSAGVLEVALMVGVGFLVASLFGWSRIDAVFLGAMLAISSTTIIVKVLGELGRMRAPSTQAIFGILLVEDLVAVILIALLSSIALTGGITVASVASLLVRVAIFVIAALVMGLVVVPRAVDHVAKLRIEEILVLVVVAIAFATSMIALALGLSIALGAFIAGAIVAESRASATVERRIAPLRDVFAAVFFVATGILVNPADVVAYWPAILILATVTILGKLAAVAFATFVAGYPPREAMRVGIGMAMIGEFSFVIATLGADTGVTSAFLLPIAVAVSATTALVTPPLIRNSDSIITWMSRRAPASLRDFAHMYHAWVGRARRGQRADESDAEAFHGRYDMGALLRAVSYGAVLVASAVGARVAHESLQAAFPGRAGVVSAAVFGAWVLLAIPIVVGLARAVRELVDNLVYVVVPPRLTTAGRGQAAASVLRHTLYAFLAVLVTLVGVAAGAAFLPPLPLLLGALVVVAIAAFALRGSLRRLNSQIAQAVDVVFQADAPPLQRDQVLSMIRERYPWDMHVQSFIVPSGSRAAHRRIRDLALPQKTGASIVSHERDGVQTVNPPPDTLILPGDTVGVLGEEQQVAEARAILTSEMPIEQRPLGTTEDGVHIEEIDITPESPLAGHTLAGSRLRETTGASIVGLRREGVPILNPAPVLRLQPGDTVVVLGSYAQVAAARRLFNA